MSMFLFMAPYEFSSQIPLGVEAGLMATDSSMRRHRPPVTRPKAVDYESAFRCPWKNYYERYCIAKATPSANYPQP